MDKLSRVLLIFILLVSVSFGETTTEKNKKEEPKQTKEKKQTSETKDKKTKETKDTKEEYFPLSGTFDITSNYIFRGISQTDNIPAFQGGINYKFKDSAGLFVGTWGSNVFFRDEDDPTRVASVEIDGLVGFSDSFPCNDKIKYDIHFVRYFYPKAHEFEYNELIGSLTYYCLTGLIGYTDNLFNLGGSGTYFNLAVNLAIPEKYSCFKDVSFNVAVGYYLISHKSGNSYLDYSLSLSKVIKAYTLTIQWEDTNHRLTNDSLDHGHVVGTILVTF